MFEYRAELVRIVDGDTLDADIDLGFDVHVKKRIRLYGINTPESRTRDGEHLSLFPVLEEKKRGKAATQYVKDWFEKKGSTFKLKSMECGKYGRVLGRIKIGSVCLNEALVESGHAVEYFGGKR